MGSFRGLSDERAEVGRVVFVLEAGGTVSGSGKPLLETSQGYPHSYCLAAALCFPALSVNNRP